MAKRIKRRLSEVAAEVEAQLLEHHNVTKKQLAAWRKLAQTSKYTFPINSMIDINEIFIDYEIQRDVLEKHILNIIKRWDARVCSPVSTCRVPGGDLFLFDGQHRGIAAVVLGFTEIPGSIVETNDPQFASYAFELLNDTGVKKLTPGDLHRNALVRAKLGSTDPKAIRAHNLQEQFDNLEIDLQDKKSRASITLRGDYDYFFSHFAYANKVMDHDMKGKVINNILSAIKTTFPNEEIDQGLFIGLYELYRLSDILNVKLPNNWMTTLLTSVQKSFSSSHVIHQKAKVQWEHTHTGMGWNAPTAMSNFLRELHIINDGKLNLPFHGKGSLMGIIDGNFADGLFPVEVD